MLFIHRAVHKVETRSKISMSCTPSCMLRVAAPAHRHHYIGRPLLLRQLFSTALPRLRTVMVRHDHVLALGYNGITIQRTLAPSPAAHVAPDCVRRMRSSQQATGPKCSSRRLVTRMGDGAIRGQGKRRGMQGNRARFCVQYSPPSSAVVGDSRLAATDSKKSPESMPSLMPLTRGIE